VPRSRILATGLGLVLATSVVGCADLGLPMPGPTPSPTYAVTGDGVLRIGTLLPTTGSDAYLGAGQIAGVEAAVREINEAGGVNGVPVEVYHRNSGDATSETAEASYADLVAKGVDVVIGPSSSVLVERLVEPVVAAGVPLISPAASSPALTTLEDDGLVFRTIGSYAAQGAVITDALAEAKAKKLAYLYVDDAAGQALLESITADAEDAGLDLAYSGAFTATTADISSVVSAAKKAKPDAVVIASSADAIDATSALITALTAAKLGGSTLWLTSQNLADYSQALPAGTLDGVNGVLEGAQPDEAFIARLKQADPAVGAYRYAEEAYDATIVAALAATVAGDDGGPAIARLLPVVSKDGITCTSFGACIDVLRTQPDINYDGVSGLVDLAASGDVTKASWGVYVYGAGNTTSLVRTVVAG